jgi:hypothetical protein
MLLAGKGEQVSLNGFAGKVCSVRIFPIRWSGGVSGGITARVPERGGA